MSSEPSANPAANAAKLEPVTGPSASGGGATAPGAPRFLARLGLAIAHPRWALALAADRNHAGRAGSDLIAAIGLLLVATQLRGLAAAAWLGRSVDAGLGVRTAMAVLTRALTVDLGLLVLGALVVFALSGARRNLGRAFDLACVGALPLVFVDLGATVAVRCAGLAAVPAAVSWLLSGISYAWMGALVALATRSGRARAVRVPAPPAEVLRPARRLGWGVAAIVALGIASQIVWIASNLSLVRPMTTGDEAPGFALPEIGPTGALGDRVTLAASRGKVTVLDFWATWCKPCLASMPHLEKLARSHPDVTVLAINVDDPAAPAQARAVFNEHGYTMKLLADDGDTSQRYGAEVIPHTVIIDRSGIVREVVRGAGANLAARVDAVRASD